MLTVCANFSAAQTTYTWDGSTGDWAIASNWSPSGTPADEDSVIIGSGTVGLEADATVAGVALNGGTLQVADDQTLTVTDAFAWTGGAVGRRNSSTGHILLSGTSEIRGDDTKTFAGGVLANEGSLTWSGSGNINVNTGGTLQNAADATLTIAAAAGVTRTNGSLHLINDGTILKTGPDTAFFGWVYGTFTNNGRLRIEEGTFRITLSGLQATGGGEVEVQESATLNTQSNLSFDSESTITVGGTLNVQAGTATFGSGALSGQTNIVGGVLDFANTAVPTTIASATVSGGRPGGAGTKNVTSLSWTGGALGTPFSAAGEIHLQTTTISGENDKGFAGGTVTIGGFAVWEGSGNLVTNTDRRLVIAEGAEFDIRTDAGITRVNGTLSVHNLGTIVKSAGTGTTTFNLPFTTFANDGAVRVESGTLSVNAGATSTDTGDYSVASSARMRFANHTRNFTETVSISGSGSLEYASAPVNSSATIEPGDTIGMLSFLGNFPGPTASSSMVFGIGGTVPDADHDVFSVSGSVTLGGTLRIEAVNGFVFSGGQAFTVITAAGVEGSFDALIEPEGVTGHVVATATGVDYVIDAVVAREDSEPLPATSRLNGVYPNPFQSRATIAFQLASGGPTRLSVFDLLGREISVLGAGDLPAGFHELAVEASDLVSGLYIVRLQTVEGAVFALPVTVVR